MLALAYRVGVYGGMISARTEERQGQQGRKEPKPEELATKASILADPLLREVIGFG